MSRFSRVLRVEWPRLVVELFVLVAGITISFAVDAWRREREDRREERRVWVAIRENLDADSSYLATRIAQLQRMTRSYDGLLGSPPRDSLDTFMDLAISYVVFTPTQGAYDELRQMAGSRLIRNRALLADLNLVRTNRAFKDAQLSTYQAALKRVIGIRSSIARELALQGGLAVSPPPSA